MKNSITPLPSSTLTNRPAVSANPLFDAPSKGKPSRAERVEATRVDNGTNYDLNIVDDPELGTFFIGEAPSSEAADRHGTGQDAYYSEVAGMMATVVKNRIAQIVNLFSDSTQDVARRVEGDAVKKPAYPAYVPEKIGEKLRIRHPADGSVIDIERTSVPKNEKELELGDVAYIRVKHNGRTQAVRVSSNYEVKDKGATQDQTSEFLKILKSISDDSQRKTLYHCRIGKNRSSTVALLHSLYRNSDEIRGKNNVELIPIVDKLISKFQDNVHPRAINNKDFKVSILALANILSESGREGLHDIGALSAKLQDYVQSAKRDIDADPISLVYRDK